MMKNIAHFPLHEQPLRTTTTLHIAEKHDP